MKIKKATVYCASSRMVDDKYFDATRRLAYIMVKNRIVAIYGGGAVGLMGALADYYLLNKGKITGVIPEFMLKVEWGHKGLDELIVVKDMHARKKRLIKDTDAVIALPGGTGTLEELMEVISLKRLGKFNKPIIILNTDGFYNALKVLLDKMVEEQFIREEHKKMWTFINEPEELMEAIRNTPEWPDDAINIASAG